MRKLKKMQAKLLMYNQFTLNTSLKNIVIHWKVLNY